MENNNNYKLDEKHVANLYNQQYLREAPRTEKFESLDGALQRSVIEEALIQVEAHKLSSTYKDEVNGKEAAYFSKYREFYAYQAAKNPQEFREKDSKFLSQHWSKSSRDSARNIEITERARLIDGCKGSSVMRQIQAMKGKNR